MLPGDAELQIRLMSAVRFGVPLESVRVSPTQYPWYSEEERKCFGMRDRGPVARGVMRRAGR
jgi:hypothetical protein